MNVSLREITLDNFTDCVNLKVAEDQKYFVSTNVMSIALSKVASYLVPLAVYDDDKLVGFTLHGKNPKSKKYYISRLMIDEKFQGKGFGKQTTLMLIEKMGENEDCNEIYLFFVPENTRAEKLYSNIGFKRTGVIDEDGELEMRLDLRK